MGERVMRQNDALSERQTEQWLTHACSQLLRIAETDIKPDASFFALGGDSLFIVQLMDRVNAHFFAHEPDQVLPITDFFAHPSVRALAKQVCGTLQAASVA